MVSVASFLTCMEEDIVSQYNDPVSILSGMYIKITCSMLFVSGMHFKMIDTCFGGVGGAAQP